jgi:hypothetical protein
VAQYDTEQRVRWEQEEAIKKLLAETAKVCPNPECGYYIKKNKGCNHMTRTLLAQDSETRNALLMQFQ